ncbi:MAG: YqhA family protein [Phycisphaerales bacterium]|jgi:uncharacterized membrane protein YqhA|nr:YqhA family protein [Phycisphaerales bacterium]
MKRKSKPVELLENCIENFLWHFRLIIILGVFGLLICSAVIFTLGIIETIEIAIDFVRNVAAHGLHVNEYGPATEHHAVATEIGAPIAHADTIIVGIITVVDDFLLGIVLLIFGLGTYDLFISRIDPAEEQDDIRPDWLVFSSLDELKSVLGKVVLMIMIISFLKFVVNIGSTFKEPVHILYLGVSIALIALALKWSHSKDIEKSTMADRIAAKLTKHSEDAEEKE